MVGGPTVGGARAFVALGGGVRVMAKAAVGGAPRPAASRLVGDAIVAAALDFLDDKGLRRLTLAAIAERMGTERTAVLTHFERRQDLLAAMVDAMQEQASQRPVSGSGWQDKLRRRAVDMRKAMLSRRDGALMMAEVQAEPIYRQRSRALVVALSEQGFRRKGAQSALALVDRFTLGWTLAEQSGGTVDDASFTAQLETVLKGIGVECNVPDVVAAPVQHRAFPYRLWGVLRNVRESANIAYARTIKLNELDRRILLLLKENDDFTLAGISTSTGVDKAQVSRAVKRLSEMGLISRTGIRSPLALSAEGTDLTDRIGRLAELRNRELTFGITDEDIVGFFGVIEELMVRAMALHEQERKLGGKQLLEGEHQELPPNLPRNAILMERARVMPPLITLCAYIHRGNALCYKRLTGLSNFDVWVLSEIGAAAPLGWPQLVQALLRDQSQAGRTVRRLIELGLIERTGAAGRRHGFFSLTKEGERAHALIHDVGDRRNASLFQDIDSSRLADFFAAFETLARNAEAQLAREHALEEIEPD